MIKSLCCTIFMVKLPFPRSQPNSNSSGLSAKKNLRSRRRGISYSLDFPDSVTNPSSCYDVIERSRPIRPNVDWLIKSIYSVVSKRLSSVKISNRSYSPVFAQSALHCTPFRCRFSFQPRTKRTGHGQKLQ